MPRVLLVDDEPSILRMLTRTFEAEGFSTRSAADGAGALRELERELPDLVVLDVVMPAVDGLGVARRLRARGANVPILFLTARDALGDRVAGLDAGGDDYLVKPFAVEELLARVRALLRRGAHGPTLAYADLVLDVEQRLVRRGGRTISLTAREAELLAVLMRHGGSAVSRETLLHAVWERGGRVDNVLDRYVSYLRRKLGDPPLIDTVRGVGFALRR